MEHANRRRSMPPVKWFWPVFAAGLIAASPGRANTYLVIGGTLTGVTSTASNQPAFSVRVSGGSTNLCSGQWIQFSQADAPDADTFKRAYAAALVALTAGTPVSIYNYIDTTCVRAGYLQLGQ
jgi:hypothetical protein